MRCFEESTTPTFNLSDCDVTVCLPEPPFTLTRPPPSQGPPWRKHLPLTMRYQLCLNTTSTPLPGLVISTLPGTAPYPDPLTSSMEIIANTNHLNIGLMYTTHLKIITVSSHLPHNTCHPHLTMHTPSTINTPSLTPQPQPLPALKVISPRPLVCTAVVIIQCRHLVVLTVAPPPPAVNM